MIEDINKFMSFGKMLFPFFKIEGLTIKQYATLQTENRLVNCDTISD